MTESFGLKPPAPDADTRAWLRPQGIRDLASGLVVLTNDADRGQAVGRHSSHRFCHHPSWRHVNRSGVGRLEVEGALVQVGELCFRSQNGSLRFLAGFQFVPGGLDDLL